MSFAWLAEPVPLASFPPLQRRMVGALRHWAVAHKLGQWPTGTLQDHLGCPRAAAHLRLVIEEIGAAWPDPFCVSPLCCRRTSHDEALAARLLGAAAAADRPGFDRISRDLLGEDARDRLFLSLCLLAGAMAAAPVPD